MRNLKGKIEAFKKFSKYIIDTDRYETGFRVKNDKNLGWVVLDRDGRTVIYDNYKAFENAKEIKEPDTRNKKMTELEFKAVEKMLEIEAKDLAKQGFTPEQINAVMNVRMTTNKGFELLFAPMRKIIEAVDRGEIKMPMVSVFEDKKLVRISLKDAMAKMGDMRGYYFPRIRRTGQYVMYASKEGEFTIIEPFNSRFVNKFTVKDLESKGYKVEIKPSRKVGEDVFELSGNLVKTQQIVNAALERMDKTAKEKLSDEQLESLQTELDSIFATSLAEQISNIIRERGARAHMTRRSQDVYVGYEEDPLIAIPKYVQSGAGAKAKKNMTLKMLRALTGTEASWAQFKQENPEADYKDYRKLVEESMISQADQQVDFKWAMVYIKENTRNPEKADRVVGAIRGMTMAK